MLIITIHRGELLQIKRMIASARNRKDKKPKGSLYGLYTESYQPVVLIVIGSARVCCGDKKKIDKYLWKKHKLLKLGEWIASPNPKKDQRGSKTGITLKFDDEGEIAEHFKGKEAAYLDIIESQSAFREYQSLTKYLQDKTKLDTSPIEIEEKEKETMPPKQQPPVTQSRSMKDHIIDVESHNKDASCCTRTSQWYNIDRDIFQTTFEFVRSTFTDDGTVKISRNTLTEDMEFKFIHSRFSWVIEFPAEFPRGVVNILKKMSGSEEKVSLALQEWQPTANLANMKNMLQEGFFDMCRCQKCSSRESQSWVQ